MAPNFARAPCRKIWMPDGGPFSPALRRASLTRAMSHLVAQQTL